MSTNPVRQARNGIRPRSRQDFKLRLFRQRFPDLSHAESWTKDFHLIDASNPAVTKIATRDGGHVEIHGRFAKVYGTRGIADQFAAELDGMAELDDIERLEELKSIQRRGCGLRQRRRPDEVPSLSADRVEGLADRWRSRGFHRITESPDGVWIEIGRCRIQDLGDELRIHGPAASDAAVRAMVEKAAVEWSSEFEVFGDAAFKDSAWLEAQRQGVTVYDQATGELYQPSEEIRRRYHADQSRMRGEEVEIEEIKRRKAIAALLLDAAGGDTEALTRLRTNDAQLADFRAFGQAARAQEDERHAGKASEGLTPDVDRPEDEAELEAWRRARYEARVKVEDERKWGPS